MNTNLRIGESMVGKLRVCGGPLYCITFSLGESTNLKTKQNKTLTLLRHGNYMRGNK